jgi:SAM-dependent methyltransferase
MLKRPLRRALLWSVVHLSPRLRYRMRLRRRLAAKFVRGTGLEIGALHLPLQAPGSATVVHVDYRTTRQLRSMYPELALLRTVDVDIVSDGEVLSCISAGSVDFVVANHVIEHCENPIGTLENWLRVLRPGGVIFMAVPDQRKTFDRARPLTTVEHLLRDYREGPEWSRRDHLREYATLAAGVAPAEVTAVVDKWIASGIHPHYHVWTPESFSHALNVFCREEHLPFRVEVVTEAPQEFLVVLRKVESDDRCEG